MRLVAGVDDRALEGRLQANLDLEVVGPLADLEAVRGAVLADADPPCAADHLTGDEERRDVADDVAERRLPAHQVVLVRAVGRTLVVGVVLVQQDLPGVRDGAGSLGRVEHDQLAGLVPHDDIARGTALRRGVLRVRVVDVQPCPVGEDHVGQAEVLVGELRGVGDLPRHVEAPGVAQRALLLEVPACPARAHGGVGVGVDDLGGRKHGVGVRLAGHRDAELGLGSHHSLHAHTPSVRVPSSPGTRSGWAR